MKKEGFYDPSNEREERIASVKTVREFLNKYQFDGYQSIDLPYGLKISGMDRSKSANAVFKYPVKGKAVLDVGCGYGYFCHEAILRGASKAVGIETSKERASIAKEISSLWTRNITILSQDFYDIDDSIHYDIVLFLNMLHHVVYPVEAMKKLAKITDEMMIVEFATLLDRQININLILRGLYNIIFSNLPLVYIGYRKYHRVWYFSKHAFNNLFVEQMNLFRRVEFGNSPRKRGRLIAYCWV